MPLIESGADASSRAALRAIRQLCPDADVIDAPAVSGEQYGAYGEQPRIVRPELAEGTTLRAVRVSGDPEVKFAAFLDGVQKVRILAHRSGVPIVLGIVSAVVRVRLNRCFFTWEHQTPIVHRRLYMPLRYLPELAVREAEGFAVVDTTEADESGEFPSRHPGALHHAAIERVRRDREELERRLAEAWCSREDAPIFIDGPIGSSGRVASAMCAVGVVKSHQTLYADEDALRIVLGLKRGERSSVFRLASRGRAAVGSWYLRVRDASRHDAMFGLVRIETSLADDMARRAEDVSRWVLAEAAPLALPDGRWDKMAYGIRNCEEFLRAIS